MPMTSVEMWTITCDGDDGMPHAEVLCDPDTGAMVTVAGDVLVCSTKADAEMFWRDQAGGQILARSTGRVYLCGDHRIEDDPDDVDRRRPIDGQEPIAGLTAGAPAPAGATR